jgi:hypothetical protein
MVRILPDYIDLNVPFEIYLKRTDLWNCQISEDDIETIQLDETILLKHTFIILIGLENRLNGTHEQPLTSITTPKTTNEKNLGSLFRPDKRQTTISDKKSFRTPRHVK